MKRHSDASPWSFDNYRSNNHTDTVVVGLNNIPPIYDVKGKLEGQHMSNMKFINSKTGGTAIVKGQSGVEPLYINIEHTTLDGLRRTRHLVLDLVKSVYEDLRQSCPATIKHLLCLPPHLDDNFRSLHSPPPDKKTVHDSSLGTLQETSHSIKKQKLLEKNRMKRRRKREARRSKEEERMQASSKTQAGHQQNKTNVIIAKPRLLVEPPQLVTPSQPVPMANQVVQMTKGHGLQQLPQSSLLNALQKLKQRLEQPTPQQSAADGLTQPILQQSGSHGLTQPILQQSGPHGLTQPSPQQSEAHGLTHTTLVQKQSLPQHNQPYSGEMTKVLQKLQQVLSLLQNSRQTQENRTTPVLHRSDKKTDRSFQFVPEQRYNACGTLKNKSAQKEKDEQIKILFGNTMSSAAIKREKVICRTKQMFVLLMPENGESLYSALACNLFGPFRSVLELNEMAASLHNCAVRYIRRNKAIFYKDLENLYNRLFPDHKLDPGLMYEHGCLYLSKPDHKGEENCIRAIARFFDISVVVHYEDGRELTKYDPASPSSLQPITIIRRIRPQGYHYDLVIDSTPEITSPSPAPSPKPNQGPQLMRIGCTLNVVTWDVSVCSNKEVQCILDEALSSKNIDMACIQATLPPQTSHGKALTAHYRWWFKVLTDKPSRGVAILVNQNFEGIVSNFVSTSEYLASIDFNYNKTNFVVIGCHLPESVDIKYNTVSADLISALNRAPSSYQTLLLGQFNARIGTLDIKNQEHHLIGRRLYDGNSNKNGMLLKELAINRNLRIISIDTNDKCTPCQQNRSNKTIQQNRDELLFEKEKSQISHILIKNWVNILDVQKFSWWESCSDHAVVGCSIALVPHSPLVTLPQPLGFKNKK